ncbi:Rha family transcriptional regulator [Aeromonas veronii]|uniref:Rha family transcriptional regulator n=2 Tax=Aeromonas veronii TaxID=654 RepID=UPI0018F11FA3|nr:Rha family transcriptional regulator [Aeromonas veronii]MBJ7581646.1 Rha family transcriptional regulator [Aeromonas veronii]
MNTITTFAPADIISLNHGQPMTTSLKVAEIFGKRHDDVLKKIRNLECSAEFNRRNFAEVSYDVAQPNGGKAAYKAYEMTKDGFIFVVMGFTGKQAAAIKEAYINAFNWMAAQLAARTQPDYANPLATIDNYTSMLRKADRDNVLLERQLEDRLFLLMEEMNRLRDDMRAIHRNHTIARDLADHIGITARFALPRRS